MRCLSAIAMTLGVALCGLACTPATQQSQTSVDEAPNVPDKRAEADVHYLAGLAAHRGSGVPQNFNLAMEHYQRAIDLGSADALFSMATMYENGNGVEQNQTEALRLYKQAADAGHLDAQVNLGAGYLEGAGVPKDISAARKWFQKAADQGSALAMRNLGALAYHGVDGPKDNIQALKWIRLAVYEARGADRQEFKRLAKLVSSEMDDSDTQRSLSLARELNPKVGATDIIWADQLSRDPMTWDQASAFCESLPSGGSTNWRLPTVGEMEELIDSSPEGVGSRLPGGSRTNCYLFSGTPASRQEDIPFVMNVDSEAIFNGDGFKGHAWCVRYQ